MFCGRLVMMRWLTVLNGVVANVSAPVAIMGGLFLLPICTQSVVIAGSQGM
jgi:hypothetical protein